MAASNIQKFVRKQSPIDGLEIWAYGCEHKYTENASDTTPGSRPYTFDADDPVDEGTLVIDASDIAVDKGNRAARAKIKPLAEAIVHAFTAAGFDCKQHSNSVWGCEELRIGVIPDHDMKRQELLDKMNLLVTRAVGIYDRTHAGKLGKKAAAQSTEYLEAFSEVLADSSVPPGDRPALVGKLVEAAMKIRNKKHGVTKDD